MELGASHSQIFSELVKYGAETLPMVLFASHFTVRPLPVAESSKATLLVRRGGVQAQLGAFEGDWPPQQFDVHCSDWYPVRYPHYVNDRDFPERVQKRFLRPRRVEFGELARSSRVYCINPWRVPRRMNLR